MIDNNVYDDIMTQWGCNGVMTVEPDTDLRRWCVQQTVTVLANADYYYTRAEVDKLIEEITVSGVTKQEVEEMIQQAIATKANQADLDALSAQVASNTAALLNTYTKQETNALLSSYYTKLQTNSMFGNYSKVEGSTLILNSENIN